MGIKVLNLNNYEVTTDLEKASLKIIPHASKDGTQLPAVLWVGVKSKRFEVTTENKDTTEWHPRIFNSDKGDPKEYCAVVDWWFAEASKNEEYKERVYNTYRNLNNIADHIKKAHNWLCTEGAYFQDTKGKYDKRKKEIGKFLDNWLSRSLTHQTTKRY